MNALNRLAGWAAAVSIGGIMVVLGCTDTPTTGESTAPGPSLAVANPAAKVVLSVDTVRLASSGASSTLSARAIDASGAEVTGVTLKWWSGDGDVFTFAPEECSSPCGVAVTSGNAGLEKIIVHEYGGTAADTAWVVVGGGSEPPPPPPPPTVSCLDGRTATLAIRGPQTDSYDQRDGLLGNTSIDASTATWTNSGEGAPIRAGDGANICWHGGGATNTYSDDVSWHLFHFTYAFVGYGPQQVVEDFTANNFGDGIKWLGDLTEDWTVRRVHLLDMHDACVEAQQAKSGRIEDVLFEGCYTFLDTRPDDSGDVDGSNETVVVDGAVVWMKPTATVYSGPAPSTGGVFRVDNSIPSKSPRMVLRNVVLRVDVEPGVGNACLNPNNLVTESTNNTVVWLGSGDYPCLPIPPGWTLSTDKAVWDRAVADWIARNLGQGGGGSPPPAPVATVSVAPDPASVQVGATVQLTATLEDAAGAPLTGRTVSWSSDDDSKATVSSSGLVSGIAAGSATITATSEGKSGTSAVTVTALPPPPPAPVATVSVAPDPASVQVGATVQLTATLKDATGNTLTGRTVSWSSNAGSKATVSSSGLVSGIAAGSATITATSEGKSGTSAVTVTAPGSAVTFVGAGDIASCSSTGDDATANLLDGIPGTVFTAGDNAYTSGSTSEFTNCYQPTWGRHLARTKPSPGNHDYNTANAAGYFAYYGANAGPAGRGYYSYDLGAWHIVSLNSNVSMTATSPQAVWLKADLAGRAGQCILAYWHHPRFSSGTTHGNFTAATPIWQILYDSSADVVVVGHEHNYERFAPQTPAGVADPVRGIREFVIGTGGVSHYAGHNTIPNSEVFNGSTWGVMKFTLGASGYTWQFIPTTSGGFTDSGSGACH